MQALKYTVRIGRDSKVVVDVPGDEGEEAEVIVLLRDRVPGVSAPPPAGRPLADLLNRLASWGGPERSIEDIDAQIAEERASWGDR